MAECGQAGCICGRDLRILRELERERLSSLHQGGSMASKKGLSSSSSSSSSSWRQVDEEDEESPLSLVGTCTSMCPVHERYKRELERRLHPFERASIQHERPTPDGGGGGGKRPVSKQQHYCLPVVDHDKAVKEFSRPSAGKDLPLVEDLRTAEALTKTMHYLLTEILDDENENLINRFEFVWDRIRGIRQDITYQPSLDPQVVVCLLHDAIKFHIYADYRLCTFPASKFDSKLNSEDLFKCFHSLFRHLHVHPDLLQTSAAHEAYSFYLLLQLGNEKWIQLINNAGPQVVNSPQLILAMKIFQAYQSRNFVRFFRLLGMSTTPFFTCCCASRVLCSFRHDSLSVINAAYASSVCKFPIKTITTWLLYSSDEEASNDAKRCGITVVDGPSASGGSSGSGEMAHLALRKNAFSFPAKSDRVHFDFIDKKHGHSISSTILSF